MVKKSKPFNIAIYPSKDISKKAIKVSKKLKSKGGLFILDDKNYFPHVSVYMTEFPLKNLPKIKKLLQKIASETEPFQIISLRYRQNKGGYVDVVFRRSLRIKKFQEEIVKVLNPMREKLIRERTKMSFPGMNKAQQKNIKLYGYHSVGSEFYPHLTFTRLEKFDKPALSVISKANFSFEVGKIALFYLGDHGTCNKLVEIFDLS